MKKLQTAILLLFSIGCSEENLFLDQPGSISIQTAINDETNDINFNGRIEASLSDLSVKILDESGLIVENYEDASQLPNEIELPPGSYLVEASSKQEALVAFDAPSYFGQSNSFEEY